MASINLDIWLALKTRVDALSITSALWPVWPIAWPGSDYSPVSGKPFLAVGKVTAQPVRRVINQNISDRTGMLMVSAVMPLGQDAAVYEDVAGKIVDQFQGCIYRNGLTMRLMSASGVTAYPTDGYRDGGWWRVPVTIPWRTWM